jgi:hypothetical protein
MAKVDHCARLSLNGINFAAAEKILAQRCHSAMVSMMPLSFVHSSASAKLLAIP